MPRKPSRGARVRLACAIRSSSESPTCSASEPCSARNRCRRAGRESEGGLMHVAITGASSGIGAALVRELAKRGDAITLVARRRQLLDELATSLGTGVHVAVADL